MSAPTRFSPLVVFFFYTRIVEDRLMILDKLSVNRLFFNFLAIFVNIGRFF